MSQLRASRFQRELDLAHAFQAIRTESNRAGSRCYECDGPGPLQDDGDEQFCCASCIEDRAMGEEDSPV